MKTILLFIFLYLISLSSKADQLIYIEKWQAEKAASYIQGEKYVIAFCDCCYSESEKPLLLKVENASFEPVGKQGYYSVRLRARKVAELVLDSIQNITSVKNISGSFNEAIDLAYTFSLTSGKAKTIGLILEFGMHPCSYFIDFPQPMIFIATDADYLTWYNDKVKTDFPVKQLLIGSWTLYRSSNVDGTRVFNSETDKLQRFVFKNNNTFFTNIGEGESGKWDVLYGNLRLINDETSQYDIQPILIEGDVLSIKIPENGRFSLLEFKKQE